MKIEERPIDSLIPYARNPRLNEKAIDAVAASLKEFGFQQPIVVDAANVVIVGHTRLKAAKKLGLTTVPVVVAANLSEDQVKAYRILDNRVGEIAEWDKELLSVELSAIDLDMSGFHVDFDDLFSSGLSKKEREIYTKKITAPVYEMTGEKPKLSELTDTSKFASLLQQIERAEGVPDDVREFLKLAAYRHVVFDYAKIAEFYAHASAEVQRLMENSALVIVDFDKAIENGFVVLTEEIAAAFTENQSLIE